MISVKIYVFGLPVVEKHLFPKPLDGGSFDLADDWTTVPVQVLERALGVVAGAYDGASRADFGRGVGLFRV